MPHILLKIIILLLLLFYCAYCMRSKDSGTYDHGVYLSQPTYMILLYTNFKTKNVLLIFLNGVGL